MVSTGSLHNGRMAQWSAARQHSANALKFKSLSMQIILVQIGLDWIIQMYEIKLVPNMGSGFGLIYKYSRGLLVEVLIGLFGLDWIGLHGHINANRIAVKD